MAHAELLPLALSLLLLCACATTPCSASPTNGSDSSDGFRVVANRDVEGSIVKPGDDNYQPSLRDCATDCSATPGCNIFIWCGATDGCISGGSDVYQKDLRRYRQCWLKSDNVSPGFPRAKNSPSQQTGWISGAALPNGTDFSGIRGIDDLFKFTDVTYGNCKCQSQYYNNGYKFKRVCANARNDYDARCLIENGCQNNPGGSEQGCPSTQSAAAVFDTDLDGKVLVSGDYQYTNSAEECSGLCAKQQFCTVWTWCSDSRGCNDGELVRFRQCWLKQAADPEQPDPKAGYGGSPGWVSGVRVAYLS